MRAIYCVEDDEGIAELIACALKSGGYSAVTFGSGAEFFAKLEKEKLLPALILLDVMLPQEDGFSILRKIRASARLKNTPVIMLTAKTSELDKVTGLEAGADDYITKPFGIMELLSRVKAVLRRVPEMEESLLSYNGLSLEREKREVSFNGAIVDITFKEFELLSLFLLNKGLVLSRDKITEKVWGYDFEGESRTVDMHVKTLRQKLETVGCIGYIKTVRGVGYKI